MKKVLFSFLLIFLALSVFSQTFEVYYNGDLLGSDAEIMVATHPDSAKILLHGIDIKNTSDNPLNVKCIRENIDTVALTENYYCWGGMYYSATVDTSQMSVFIDGQSTSSEFKGYYDHTGHIGISKIKYTFYDLANEDDQVSFYVNYNVTTELDIAENNILFKLSEVYPNPANQFVQANYEIHNIVDNAKVVIFNLLGSNVKETNVLESNGTIKLNTSDLIEGIYFYSLLINNESVITQKLIIKH